VPDGAAISNAANRSRVQSGMDIDPSDSHVGDYYIIRHMIDPLVRDDVESLSKKLADHVHNGLARAMRSFPSRGIKKGDFDVLHSLGIPRVLAEIGFVDTPRGAALFSNKLELERISREIARSVASFFSVDVVSIGSEHNLRGDPNNRRDTHHVRKSNGPTRWSFSKRS